MCRSKAQGGRRCPGNRGTQTLANVLVAERAEVETRPHLGDPANPHFNSLLNIDSEAWYATPWSERKIVISEAINEVIAFSNSPAYFRGWDRSERSLGRTFTRRNRYTGEVEEISISLSDVLNKAYEAVTIADTIAHEVAHSIVGYQAGHGPVWYAKYRELKEQLGVATEDKHRHTATEVESAAVEILKREKVRTAKYLGLCPQNHEFTASRKVTRSYSCVACSKQGLPANITYTDNPYRNS